jgi:hypothetical protein
MAEVNLSAGEFGAKEADPATGETGIAEGDLAPGEPRADEADLTPGELGANECHSGTGEPGAAEAETGAAKAGTDKANPGTGEHSGVKDNLSAGEAGTVKVAAVKDNACEIEVQALPGHRGVSLEVRGDDPDDRVAHFADGLKSKSLRRRSVLSRVGLVRHAQIATQDINAGLPVLCPVVSQAGHGVHPSQPDLGRFVAAELLGGRGESFIEGPGALLPERSAQLLRCSSAVFSASLLVAR